MDKPYRELAQLIGKVLAKRWLNRSNENIEQPNQQAPQHAVDQPDMKPNGVADVDNTPRW